MIKKHQANALVHANRFVSPLICGLHTFSKDAKRALIGLALSAVVPVQAAPELLQFSMEELMSMEVTSVSKKSQPLFEAAAAIHVITKDDIRRSGMTSIPELLRLVPGLHVARIDANKWAISSRGFNDFRGNKLLVLMDGRTLYTPLFSGVYWDVQDTPLEDIERIEVIRGPGGTLWGANAVLGVINIITKHSRDTQGGLLVARAGDHEKGAMLRYGGALGENGTLRAYAKLTDYNDFVDASGDDAYDAWGIRQGGLRADWEASARDALTLQGDVYQGEYKQQASNLEDITSVVEDVRDDADMNGGNLLFRWRRTLTQDSEWEFQAYYDHTSRDDLNLGQRIDTLDLDFQHRFPLTDHQEITWGLGYRRIEDDIDNTFTVQFDPEKWTQEVYSAFIHDEIQLLDDLRFILGSKFEHNDFTGFEYQPSARLLWQLADKYSFWGAVSRAVRTPSRAERDLLINTVIFSSPFVDPDGPGPLEAGDPVLISVFGDENFASEEVLSYELGLRGQPERNLSLDTAIFYSSFDNLLTSQVGSPSIEGMPPTHLVFPITLDNRMEGESYGLELAVNWQAGPDWRLTAGYSWLKLDMREDAEDADTTRVALVEDSNPRQQYQLRSLWNVRHDLQLDMMLYFVDDVEIHDSTVDVHIPAYTRLDMRFAWQPAKDLELSLAAQNLLDDQHPEFINRDSIPSEVPRTLYAQVKVGF